jgi:pyridoxine 5-phosphate synthase
MPRLAISLDQVAVLRESRRGSGPDPVAAAYIAEMAGADAIAVHLRSDRRHVQERDVEVLGKTVTVPFHLVTASTMEAVRAAATWKPDTVTLVPERREEVTTEGGLDVLLTMSQLERTVASLRESGFAVTLLVEPDLDQIRAAAKLSSTAVMINARHYTEAEGDQAAERELVRLYEAVKGATRLRTKVVVGLGVTYGCARAIASIPDVVEVRVGHAVVSRACLVGLDRAVREMKALVSSA